MSEIKPPVSVALIGTGEGGVAPSDTRFVAHTPEEQPNLYVKVVAPTVAILIRAVNLFLVTFSGVLGLAGLDPAHVLPVQDFKQAVAVAAWSGLSAAFIGTVKNLITVFGQLEGKYPLASGSI